MREFDFTVSVPLGGDFAPETVHALLNLLADPLFERYDGEVIPSLCDNEIILDCTIEAENAEDAVREIWTFVTEVIVEDLKSRRAGALVVTDNTQVAHALHMADPRVGMAYSGLVAA